jgi:RNA-binding protein
MRALTKQQRQYLRRLAHDLDPIVQIGKQGLGDQVVTTVTQALAVRELIKVKLLDMFELQDEIFAELAERSDSILVASIGHIAILYRQQPDPDRRKIGLPA